MSERGKKFDYTKSRVVRQASHAVEINGIMRRYGPRSKDAPTQEVVDLVGMPKDIFEARNRITKITSAFSRLSSEDREFHRNDALRWAEFVADPKNFEECVKRGYLPAPVKKAAPKAAAKPAPDGAAAKPDA